MKVFLIVFAFWHAGSYVSMDLRVPVLVQEMPSLAACTAVADEIIRMTERTYELSKGNARCVSTEAKQ